MQYDYIIVGAGLYGAVMARELTNRRKHCLVIEKRNHIGGNIYTEEIEGIVVHKYGAHIFHTSDQEVWDYVNQYATFNHYINSPLARYKDELYNLPFNMNTFHALWGVKTPAEAKKKLKEQQTVFLHSDGNHGPRNLEQQALFLAGRDIYEKLIKGYTEKQWGRKCEQLPTFILKRIPLRFTYDNNYFNDPYQGIPKGGYTKLVEKLLAGIELRLSTDFLDYRKANFDFDGKLIYTGPIDAYYDYVYGPLTYRSLRFEEEILDEENFQGNAVVNYTERDVPYTRIIEHKHFDFGTQEKTVITREYPAKWTPGEEPFYPINDGKNDALYQKYLALSKKDNILFGGRLGRYQYADMDKTVRSALDDVKMLCNEI